MPPCPDAAFCVAEMDTSTAFCWRPITASFHTILDIAMLARALTSWRRGMRRGQFTACRGAASCGYTVVCPQMAGPQPRPGSLRLALGASCPARTPSYGLTNPRRVSQLVSVTATEVDG